MDVKWFGRIRHRGWRMSWRKLDVREACWSKPCIVVDGSYRPGAAHKGSHPRGMAPPKGDEACCCCGCILNWGRVRTFTWCSGIASCCGSNGAPLALRKRHRSTAKPPCFFWERGAMTKRHQGKETLRKTDVKRKDVKSSCQENEMGRFRTVKRKSCQHLELPRDRHAQESNVRLASKEIGLKRMICWGKEMSTERMSSNTGLVTAHAWSKATETQQRCLAEKSLLKRNMQSVLSFESSFQLLREKPCPGPQSYIRTRLPTGNFRCPPCEESTCMCRKRWQPIQNFTWGVWVLHCLGSELECAGPSPAREWPASAEQN